jgi:probable HAF family extracellular repeat protein
MGEAYAVSSDGTQIVGQSIPPNGTSAVAFVYSDAAGVTYLGTLSGRPGDQSFANGVSDDGIVVGWSGAFQRYEGLICSEQAGLRPFSSR